MFLKDSLNMFFFTKTVKFSFRKMVEGNAEKFSSAVRKGVGRRSSTGSGSITSMGGVENSSVCIAGDIRQKLGTIIEEGCNIQQVQTSTGASNSRYINSKTLKTEG